MKETFFLEMHYVFRSLLFSFPTDCENPKTVWVTVDNNLHRSGDKLKCSYSFQDKSRIGSEVTDALNSGTEYDLREGVFGRNPIRDGETD